MKAAHLWLILALVIGCGCSKKHQAYPVRPLIDAGPLFQDEIRFELAVYYLPVPEHEPEEVLAKLLAIEFSQWKHVKSIERLEAGLALATRSIKDVQASYAPPDLEALKRFGHGIIKEQAEAVQDSRFAFAVDFGYGKEHVWDGLPMAYKLVGQIARETGGLVWDEETRELFSPEEWETRRITSWKTEVPAIERDTPSFTPTRRKRTSDASHWAWRSSDFQTW